MSLISSLRRSNTLALFYSALYPFLTPVAKKKAWPICRVQKSAKWLLEHFSSLGSTRAENIALV